MYNNPDKGVIRADGLFSIDAPFRIGAAVRAGLREERHNQTNDT
jgi:hypothetical protein